MCDDHFVNQQLRDCVSCIWRRRCEELNTGFIDEVKSEGGLGSFLTSRPNPESCVDLPSLSWSTIIWPTCPHHLFAVLRWDSSITGDLLSYLWIYAWQSSWANISSRRQLFALHSCRCCGRHRHSGMVRCDFVDRVIWKPGSKIQREVREAPVVTWRKMVSFRTYRFC